MLNWDDFHGPNAGYVQELYERYQRDPQSVDETTRDLFAKWQPPLEIGLSSAGAKSADIQKVVGAVNLAHAIRAYGHLEAQLDPLGSPPPGDPSLKWEAHGLTEDDLRSLPASLVGGPITESA